MVLFNRVEKVSEFSLTEYNDYIKCFPSDKVLGTVNNQEVAKKRLNLYGLEFMAKI